jgi:hypothetical protein
MVRGSFPKFVPCSVARSLTHTHRPPSTDRCRDPNDHVVVVCIKHLPASGHDNGRSSNSSNGSRRVGVTDHQAGILPHPEGKKGEFSLTPHGSATSSSTMPHSLTLSPGRILTITILLYYWYCCWIPKVARSLSS